MEKLSLSQLHVLEMLLSYISIHSKDKGEFYVMPKYVMYKQDYETINVLAKLVNSYYWYRVMEFEKK